MQAHHRLIVFVCALSAALVPRLVHGQGTGGPSGSDSRVGYIDSAIPDTLFRFRYDDAFKDTRPTRAEFFYAKGRPSGPGLPSAEGRVDFEDLMSYLEFAPNERFSGFVELPVRFVHFEDDPSQSGFSDMNAGFKYAFWRDDDSVGTFQFRVFAPTGDASRGLGNHHVSLEPAFLFYTRLTERLAAEAELRAWIPVGGTDFAGEIIRFGIGAHYEVCKVCDFRVAPVVEFVGWTVLDGKTSFVAPSGDVFVEDAAGQTIVNAKVGLRVSYSERADVYAGYGRPLTGNRWYENIFRLEFRVRF
jgi:hypothetical protein